METQKKLPYNLTIYDFFKTVAVLLMVADHYGYFFHPDETWWRVFGRLCVPIWFFLIGYAKSRDISAKMWIGGAILVAINIPTGMSIFPVNILFTMIFVRYVLDYVISHVLKGKNEFWATNTVLFLLIIPTSILWEYGTQAVIMAMYGWFIRHRDTPEVTREILVQFTVFALVTFVVIQGLTFGMNQAQFLVLEIGSLIVMGALYFFRPMEFPKLTKALPAPVVWFFKIGGRKTLEIYVIHLLIFKVMAVFYGRFDWFDWTWTLIT